MRRDILTLEEWLMLPAKSAGVFRTQTLPSHKVWQGKYGFKVESLGIEVRFLRTVRQLQAIIGPRTPGMVFGRLIYLEDHR